MSVKLKADEISSIIKERIASYDLSVNVEEINKVVEKSSLMSWTILLV